MSAGLSLIDKQATYDVKLPRDLVVPNKSKQLDFEPHRLETWAATHCDSETEPVVASVSGLVRRISFPQFSQALGRCINTLPKGLANRCVVLTSEHKSNQWVAEVAKSHHQFNSTYLSLGHDHASDFVEYLERTPVGKCPKEIVLFDDASFSGNQMTNHVNAIKAKLIEKGVKCNIRVVVPFATRVALDRLQNIQPEGNVNITLHCDEVIPTIKQQMSPENFQILDTYSTETWGVPLSNPENIEQDSGIAGVYFDHKIPNNQSFILSAFARETMPRISPPYT
ncbi:MAG: hypothetical protein JSR93_07850 [Verrucomicrobia bacterium]|nr:hypothetical protein [Verrucomicrobiota bacterium]